MKKSRIFASVIYFIFTFGIGVVFAITLPGYFATFSVPAQVIEDALKEGDYLTGLVLSEPVGFCRTPALDVTFDGGGGIVLYEAVMEVYDRDSAKEPSADGLTHGMLYKCYEGFLYGREGSYDVFSKESNGTALYVTDGSGEERKIPLLDYDSDGNGTNDGISNFTQNGFIILEIKESDVSVISHLRFTDRTGSTVLEADADDLDFESPFFGCFGDIGSYNEMVAAVNSPDISSEEAEELNGKRNTYVQSVVSALGEEEGSVFTSGSEEYAAAVKAIDKRANRKAIPFIIVYFVVIYIIADFLLGTHFIIKFFKWFLFKVCKIKRKGKSVNEEDVFGHDYYSTVTIRLDLTEVPEFSGSVVVKYTGGGEEFAFSLIKADGYSATVRMKAGVYVNPFIDIDRAYGPVDLPDNLVVEGYRMEQTIKIVKREV